MIIPQTPKYLNMKKVSFSLLLAAALCFAACGNNQNKKAKVVEDVQVEVTDGCCSDPADSCCGEECDGSCDENCKENCDKHNNE